MEFLVVGAGSLGSLLGGLLAREHEVTLVGRDPHVAAVRESGLTVEGAVETLVHPDARTEPPAGRFDCALVTTKAFDTAAAARDLADTGTTLDAALSLSNGLGNEATLADALGDCAVLAGTCTYGATTPAPGVVRCTGVGEVVLGARAGGPSTTADRVGTAFTEAGIETTVAADMPRRLWEKLAVNAGINAPTALARVENGALLDGPGNAVGRRAAREVARIARAEGVDLSEAAATDAVERVAAATAANTSSMQQDVLAERRTEVDAILGTALERADTHGLTGPTLRTLAELLRAWERARGLR
ncbi:ketopantoate reductase family protein [Haloglomus litoreum]|uniref:ketopantoate reductase family protein n=1 Tax=Haloglomus litoreum TaxID=3034026 RepID=UPI0023E88A68|nr:2-dehydropantoate 2-reductase [Haloglomus sp. DT116]